MEKNVSPKYVYSREEIIAFEEFISKEFGSIDEIFQEIVSPDIKLDILVSNPTEARPYYVLVTCGAGAYRMDIPSRYAGLELEYAEYIICLPSYWNINTNEEHFFWPIRMLKDVARIPVSDNTWLAYGHDIDLCEEGEALGDTCFNSCVLLHLFDEEGHEPVFHFSDGRKLNLLLIYPTFPEELELFTEEGLTSFLEVINESWKFPIVNILRTSAVDEIAILSGESYCEFTDEDSDDSDESDDFGMPKYIE